jgi:glycosyltransferase involved in cell wall biosynthesis
MATIALVFPGDGRLPSVRSGVPFSIALGLEQAGASVRHVRAGLGGPLDEIALNLLTALQVPRAAKRRSLRSSRNLAFNGPGIGAVQSWAGGRRIGQIGTVDGVIQVGSSYSVRASTELLTHDDMTVVQAVDARYPGFTALSNRQVAARIERQRTAFERATACCVVTHWAARSVIEDYGISREKVFVVGGGRNHDPRPVDRDWSVPRFLFVGKDWERKNGPGVLRAFARLRLEIPHARLDIVGKHPRLAADGVTTHGWLPMDTRSGRARLDSLFETATCFVMPSRHEPSGIVFSEANAAGIPSIGTTEGGSGELIGDAGTTVHPDDDEGLLIAMRDLADPARAELLSRRARARSARYTWRAVGERLLRALQLPSPDNRPLADFL